MGRGYYGVPGTGPDFAEDEDYYYEYEPILTRKNQSRHEEEQEQNSGLSPGVLIVFLMGLPFLPIWAGLAILGHSLRIAALGNGDEERRAQMHYELQGFIFWFVVGVLFYMIGVPILKNAYYHVA